MISDFDTNTIYFSELLKTEKKFAKTFKEISSVLKSIGIIPKFLPKTKDIWARDYMPIQVTEKRFIEYRYDPDYLQGSSDEKKTRELKTYPDIVTDAIGLKTVKSDIIIDGGNVVKYKNKVILTDKILWENQNDYSASELEKTLQRLFKVKDVLFIPWDEDCEFGHSDGILRFINENTVLISGFYETVDLVLKKELLKVLELANLKWEWLRCSEKETEEHIAYINFLQTKDLILLPRLNKKEEDKEALKIISKFYKNYADKERIFQIDMTEIVKFGGASNCISWTIKENIIESRHDKKQTTHHN